MLEVFSYYCDGLNDRLNSGQVNCLQPQFIRTALRFPLDKRNQKKLRRRYFEAGLRAGFIVWVNSPSYRA